MKATHTNYGHPRHLRVEHTEKDGSDGVWCVSPSASIYSKLNKPGLKDWLKEGPNHEGQNHEGQNHDRDAQPQE